MMINLSQLDNGLRVASRTMPHVSTLSIGVWIGVGARDELENDKVLLT